MLQAISENRPATIREAYKILRFADSRITAQAAMKVARAMSKRAVIDLLSEDGIMNFSVRRALVLSTGGK